MQVVAKSTKISAGLLNHFYIHLKTNLFIQ